MAIEYKTYSDANYNPYIVKYYCYEDDCPGRTKERPWPKSDGAYKWTIIKSKKGNEYKRKRWVCDHCGKIMAGTVSMDVFG